MTMARAPSGLAAFDFDGTLIQTDSFVGFLRLVAGRSAVTAAFARSWRTAARAGRDPAWRDAVKAVLIGRLLAGRDAELIARLGASYAETVAARVTPAMRERLARHRDAGHRIVVVSASLEVYLSPAGALLGADAVLATRLEVGADGRLTGRMEGANCRGLEKARRLSAWMLDQELNPELLPVWAYGDSAGDREMLALAHFATKVRRARPPSGPGTGWRRRAGAFQPER